MPSIEFNIKEFLEHNPSATKEEIVSALVIAPKVCCGISESIILDYLANNEDKNDEDDQDDEDDNCHIFTEDQVIPLLPDIMFYLEQHASMKSGVTWSDIDTAHKVILSR